MRSKHGIILECALKTDDAFVKDDLETFGASLTGKRYGFIENEMALGNGPVEDVCAWLVEETSR